MKVFTAFIFAVVMLQASAESDVEDLNAAPRSERVDRFRNHVNLYFRRFQDFYDRTNAETRNYRLAHVDQINIIYDSLMTVFGEDIQGVRQLAYYLNDQIDARVEAVGSVNPCIQQVMDARQENSERVGAQIQACATYANRTLSAELTNVFYPAFAALQQQISTVPLAVIDILSRGNAMADEQQMVEYMSALFEVKTSQWESAISQILRWEKARWEVDGLFMADEMQICMAEALVDFIVRTSPLETQIATC